MHLIPTGRAIEAVLFDMDGTLIYSEDRTDASVRSLLAERNIKVPTDFDDAAFHGITWSASSDRLRNRWPELAQIDVAATLQSHFHQTFIHEPPVAVPGAVEAVKAAAAQVPVAIVTSSNHETLVLVCNQLGLTDVLRTQVSAEDIHHSKPSPEPFLLAAERIGVAPEACLIFEDSAAGVQAGCAANSSVIAMGQESGYHPWIDDFRSLPANFFLNATKGRND